MHLAHSDLSHIAPTFWSNSSSGNKLSSWSNTSRNSRPPWRSYKQLLRDSSSLGEHHSSAVLNPKAQNPPQNHSPSPYLSSVTSPQTKNTTQHLLPLHQTFHQNQNPVFQQQQTPPLDSRQRNVPERHCHWLEGLPSKSPPPETVDRAPKASASEVGDRFVGRLTCWLPGIFLGKKNNTPFFFNAVFVRGIGCMFFCHPFSKAAASCNGNLRGRYRKCLKPLPRIRNYPNSC